MKSTLKYAAIIIIATIAALVFIPGLANGFMSFFGDPTHCNEGPLNPECFCDSEESKQFYMWGGVFNYYCIDSNAIFDPNSPSFEEDALAYAKTQLTNLYPTCPSIDCEPDGWSMAVPVYKQNPIEVYAYAYCHSNTKSSYCWEIFFDVNGGAIWDPSGKGTYPHCGSCV